MARKKMYSKNATIGFFIITFALVGVFGVVSYDTNLFKGQLNIFSNKGLTIESPEIVDGTLCGADQTCAAGTFSVTSSFSAPDTTILIQEPTTQTVIAKYSIDLIPNTRVDVPFSGNDCGVYSYDLNTSTYTKTDSQECPAGVYEFVVLGNSLEQGLFAEAVKFALTK